MARPKTVRAVREIGDFEFEARRRRFYRDLFVTTVATYDWEKDEGRSAELALDRVHDLIHVEARILNSRRVAYRVPVPAVLP